MTKRQRAAAIKRRVEGWFRKHPFLTEGTKWVSATEWKARGERIGAGALINLIIEESPLYMVLNYAENRKHDEWAEEFRMLCNDLGVFMEQGFAWSLHWYER